MQTQGVVASLQENSSVKSSQDNSSPKGTDGHHQPEEYNMLSLKSVLSNVSEHGRIRLLTEKLKKVEDEQVQLLIQNKRLQTQINKNGKNSYSSILGQSNGHMSVPNLNIDKNSNGELSKHNSLNESDTNSELVEEDSIVDFGQQVENMQDVNSSDINFDDSNIEDCDANSFQMDTPKVTFLDENEKTNHNFKNLSLEKLSRVDEITGSQQETYEEQNKKGKINFMTCSNCSTH